MRRQGILDQSGAPGQPPAGPSPTGGIQRNRGRSIALAQASGRSSQNAPQCRPRPLGYGQVRPGGAHRRREGAQGHAGPPERPRGPVALTWATRNVWYASSSASRIETYSPSTKAWVSRR